MNQFVDLIYYYFFYIPFSKYKPRYNLSYSYLTPLPFQQLWIVPSLILPIFEILIFVILPLKPVHPLPIHYRWILTGLPTSNSRSSQISDQIPGRDVIIGNRILIGNPRQDSTGTSDRNTRTDPEINPNRFQARYYRRVATTLHTPHSTVILKEYFENIPLKSCNIAKIFIKLLETFVKYCRNLAMSVQNIINGILL